MAVPSHKLPQATALPHAHALELLVPAFSNTGVQTRHRVRPPEQYAPENGPAKRLQRADIIATFFLWQSRRGGGTASRQRHDHADVAGAGHPAARHHPLCLPLRQDNAAAVPVHSGGSCRPRAITLHRRLCLAPATVWRRVTPARGRLRRCCTSSARGVPAHLARRPYRSCATPKRCASRPTSASRPWCWACGGLPHAGQHSMRHRIAVEHATLRG